ncbi:MAG: hypothetical protein CMC08_09305 [Flavobacteriaceae bacterium]|nr:hypothetical protein [Flavobacteriaceae bacterium]
MHYKGESTQKDGAYYDRFFGAMKIFYHKHFHTNRLFNTLVDVGVSVAKKSRKARGNRGRSSNVQPTEAIVFTENLNVLRNISEHLHIPVTTMSKSKLSEEYISNKMLIFDAAYMSYSQILKVMESFKNQGNTFRICPPGCNFMVGSDRSDDKGAVLVF